MTRDDSRHDHWEGASAYERFMGRWSRSLARAFLAWLEAPTDGHWLEVGCGTGALTSAIHAQARPASVVATDASEQYVAHARGAVPDERVQFVTASADRLPTRAGGYDVIASSLVLNFIPDPAAALAAMRSLAADNGIVGACVWDYAGGMQFLRRFWDAAVELDPAARRFDEGERFPICSRSALEAAFGQAGLSDVRVGALEIPTTFRNFEDYWEPFVGGPGPAPGYLASLPAQGQRDLASRLEATLPRNTDGSIELRAKAWAARGAAAR